MKKVMLLSVLVLLVGVRSAEARTTIVVEDGEPDHPYQRWVNRAKVPVPSVTISETPCLDGYFACADVWSRTIHLAPEAFAGGAPRDARLFLFHELGHQFDYDQLGNRKRNRFARIVGKKPWTVPEFGPTSEFFASTYAACARPKRGWRGFWVSERWLVRTTVYRRSCRLIRLAVRDEQPGGPVSDPG